jgi:hypothetical protein
MKNNWLLTSAIVLLTAILGVIGYKLAPMLHPNADLTLPLSFCNPGFTVCTSSLPDGGWLEFSVTPQPIRPLQTLNLDVKIKHIEADRIEIDFDGTQMKMGYNRPTLSGSNGHFTGQVMLPVCITGRMEWAATVIVTSDNRQIAIPFHFEVAGR